MATNIVIPTVGDSVTSGVIGRWNKKVGDYAQRDDILLELETDKVTMEIRADAAGTVRHLAKEGDTVNVGQIVGTIEEGVAPSNAAPATSPAPAAAPAPAPKATPAAAASEVRATPLAKRTAEDLGVNLASVPAATGVGHRVSQKDVVEFAQAKPAAAAASPSAVAPVATGPRGTRRERMTPLRQRIASRLVEAQHTAAMLTTFNEVDMTAVMALRTQYKEDFEKKHGIGLGFMSFFVKASVQALKAFPMVNAYIVQSEQGPEIEKHDYMDIALAVSTPKGLLVPVLRDTQTLSMAKIESSIKDFAVRGKEGKISVDELQGGTFTITNGGVFGSLMSTPILNPPQSAILGMHAIKNRAVEDPKNPGQVAIRPMMYLALSYDHRIVDGSEAVQFLVGIKKAIEDPARLLLDLRSLLFTKRLKQPLAGTRQHFVHHFESLFAAVIGIRHFAVAIVSISKKRIELANQLHLAATAAQRQDIAHVCPIHDENQIKSLQIAASDLSRHMINIQSMTRATFRRARIRGLTRMPISSSARIQFKQIGNTVSITQILHDPLCHR